MSDKNETNNQSGSANEANEVDISINTREIIPLDIKEIIKSFENQITDHKISYIGSIILFIIYILLFLAIKFDFTNNKELHVVYLTIILLIGLLLLIAIIYNYIKIFEINRKKTELIELDAILKSIDENRKQHFLRAYLKKNVLKDE